MVHCRERGGVVPLLEVEDMIAAGSAPDWKSVFTYVNSIYSELYANKRKAAATADELSKQDEKENDPGSDAEHTAEGDASHDEDDENPCTS